MGRFWFVFFGMVGLALVLYGLNRSSPPPPLTKDDLAFELTHKIIQGQRPDILSIPRVIGGKQERREYRVTYTLDPDAQKTAENLLRTYNSDYSSLVAIDAMSGRILALASHYGTTATRKDLGHLGLRALFPSASVFKVITATAAIDQKSMTADTVIPFNGSSHTLYRRNVEKNDVNRWTRYISLREAFGKSVNSVFGKIGLFYVGPRSLQDYADRYQFNQNISSDVEFETGQTQIDPSDRWDTVEVASGFTDNTSLSPLHGALISAAIVGDGKIYEPGLVESLEAVDPEMKKLEEKNLSYKFEPKVLSQVFDADTAKELRELMRETVIRGTSRKSFRQVFGRNPPELIEFGGKTGSLNARNPHGRTDWFVGYADSGNEKIAIAVMTLHEKLWRVRSSKIAGEFFQQGFGLGVSSIGNSSRTDKQSKSAKRKTSRDRMVGGR